VRGEVSSHDISPWGKSGEACRRGGSVDMGMQGSGEDRRDEGIVAKKTGPGEEALVWVVNDQLIYNLGDRIDGSLKKGGNAASGGASALAAIE